MTVTVHASTPQGYRVVEDLKELPGLIARKDITLWIDTDGKADEIAHILENDLKLHPLVVEDIFSDREAPKIEDYGEYLYIVMHGVNRNYQGVTDLQTVEFDIVIGNHWVFTHHSMPMRTVTSVTEEIHRNPRIIQRGAAFLAHGLVDRLTDHYLPVVDRFDEEIQKLEDEVVDNPSPALLSKIFDAKRSIQRLRRVSSYQRDILQRLARGESEIIPEHVRPFYRDVYDHFVRIADLAESYRELITATLEMYMSVTANRTNEIMKVLAVISTVMLPLTFIAGVYGMNFEHMPELKWRYGYAFALGLMGAVTLGLIVWFRKRKWL